MRREGDARARVPSFLKVFRNSDCNPPRARIPRGEATLKAIFLHPPPFIQARLSKNLWTRQSSANFATIYPVGWPSFDKHSIEEVLPPRELPPATRAHSKDRSWEDLRPAQELQSAIKFEKQNGQVKYYFSFVLTTSKNIFIFFIFWSLLIILINKNNTDFSIKFSIYIYIWERNSV